jgi:hypothetical protein
MIEPRSFIPGVMDEPVGDHRFDEDDNHLNREDSMLSTHNEDEIGMVLIDNILAVFDLTFNPTRV